MTTYAGGIWVTLIAAGSKGYVFEKWSGDVDASLAGNTNISILMDKDRHIIASFAESDVRYSVTAKVDPSGSGSVVLQPDQPSSGYQVNESVTVRAVEQTGYVFRRWMGSLAGNENPRIVLVSEDKSFTAFFNPMVTTYCSPSEGGSVALEPAQFSNGYDAGTDVTIRARAAKGYRFLSWEGDASGSDRSITITVDEPKTIAARFVGQSPSRWWLWVIISLIGLIGALILLRLAYARVNRGALDEPSQLDD